MKKKLLSAVETYTEDILDFLADLVHIPSVNGRDTEQPVAWRVAEEARDMGFKTRLPASDPDRPNVVVTWGQGEKGFSIVAHMDTVAEGDVAQWSYAPFSAFVDDGRMIGRGTADNKAGLACGLYALALIRDLELLDPAEYRVVLAGVVDEESGATSDLGVRYLLDNNFLPLDGAIYAYASDMICIGHRGMLRLVIEAQGETAHTGNRSWAKHEVGVNAVTGLAELLVELEKLELPAPEHPAFTDLGFTITPGTMIQGGHFESMVPRSASALVDARFLPGQSEDEVLAAINNVIEQVKKHRPGLQFSTHIKNSLPGATIDPQHTLVQTTARQAKLFTGRDWKIAGAGPANEGYMLIGAGIPTLCGFGPEGGNAHQPDEWVSVESLPTTAAMFAAIIADYLKQDEGPDD